MGALENLHVDVLPLHGLLSESAPSMLDEVRPSRFADTPSMGAVADVQGDSLPTPGLVPEFTFRLLDDVRRFRRGRFADTSPMGRARISKSIRRR